MVARPNGAGASNPSRAPDRALLRGAWAAIARREGVGSGPFFPVDWSMGEDINRRKVKWQERKLSPATGR